MTVREPSSAVPRRALPVIIVIALVGAIFTTHGMAVRQRAAWPMVDTRIVVPPPRLARLLSLGASELAADLAWAKTLVYYGDDMTRGGSLADVEPLLELVNALDPHFRRPYRWGAYATTYRTGEPTQEEFVASIRVLERGLAVFPSDWELAWLLGVRYAYDLAASDDTARRRNRELGVTWLEHAMRMPEAPGDLPLAAAALSTQLGQRDRALGELGEMILATEDAGTRARLTARYAAMASKNEGDALADTARAFEAEWRAALPFAPAAFFALVGPAPPRALDLRAMSAVDPTVLDVP